ncbi:hypothetical protein N1851_031019 [Merluccius polli]|uniref:Tyr recombinase domain-containing protein n=1 Tax=Merluccius polli TaxID=89951 RepID=A0AA47M4L9_MERPO|nr:hypothetical protein N1851_031019 [Merluccius polli]
MPSTQIGGSFLRSGVLLRVRYLRAAPCLWYWPSSSLAWMPASRPPPLKSMLLLFRPNIIGWMASRCSAASALRNPVPRWDLPLVLGALSRPPFEPLQDLGLDVLSMKTAFLLAIASARRVSELHALSVHGECLIWHPGDTEVTLRPNPSFLSKTFSTAFVNQPLTLAAFSPSSQEMGPGQDGAPLCPVRALRRYLQLTAGIRRSDSLFVCHTGPRRGHALSKQRLTRWIVGAIELSYSSGGVAVPPHVRSHSTRGVAASWAALRGVPLSDICAAASWSSPCMFARFYSFNVVPHHPVASAVLPTPSQCP